MKEKIPFNKPYLTGNEILYIEQALQNNYLSGDGSFTKKCNQWFRQNLLVRDAILVHSCTAALEMAALLLKFEKGDEFIVPSYTFTSTANAFALHGATPVFIDIRPDTLNLNENLIEKAITKNTKAIVPVHYAGVACEMNQIMDIAKYYQIAVIEDAAQGLLSKYHDQFLGSLGNLATFSFHETKNIISGEGGGLMVNDESLIERAYVLRDKGTNRQQFFQGSVDKYTWVDIGSSFLPNEVTAAFLYAQLEKSQNIIKRRLQIWKNYHDAFEYLEKNYNIILPTIPENCLHNGHLYYIILPTHQIRQTLIQKLASKNIQSVFHYIPLHSSLYGQKCGRVSGNMKVTNDLSSRLLRLPLWLGLESFQEQMIDIILEEVKQLML